MADLIGTRWRGASGDIATVERADHVLVYGKWDTGILWAEHIGCLPKLYVEVDGGPTAEVAIDEEDGNPYEPGQPGAPDRPLDRLAFDDQEAT